MQPIERLKPDFSRNGLAAILDSLNRLKWRAISRFVPVKAENS
jgi:hypothetical protein